MDFLELTLREWRQIAYEAKNAELRDYLRQFSGSNDLFILQPISDEDHDTDGEARKAIERDLEVLGM